MSVLDTLELIAQSSLDDVQRARALKKANLTPAQLVALEAEAHKKKLAEDSLREFVEQAWDVLEPGTKFIPGVHVDAVCLHLQAMIEDRIKDLLINVPPGFAKSMIGAVFFPAWVWITRPEYRFLFSSYKAEYAVRDSVKCRTLIQSNWYQERWGGRYKLKADQNEKGKFENDHTGYRETTSVGTGTGSRAMCVVVDDSMSVDQAASDAERKRANEWWTGTMTTRLNDLRTGHLMCIQQRLHENDTTAVCIEQGGYTHLYLPNEFEADRACETFDREGKPLWKDPRTKEGQLLWPVKVGPEEVAMLKRKLGSYGYSGQYQQRPSPAGGGIFKKQWWRYWTYKTITVPPVIVRLPDGTMLKIPAVILPDKLDSQLQSWDMAFKDLSTSDYVAGGVWGTKAADRYLLDQIRERLGFPETVQAVKKMSKKWPEAHLKLVEDKANGPAVIQSLRHELPGLVAITPDGGKVARAQACSPQVESGNVYLPHPAIAPWVESFVEELANFPNGKYDDQCFVAGTLIATPTGDRRIETIRAGDLVIVPGGVCRVRSAGCTGVWPVVTRGPLTGTERHPVFDHLTSTFLPLDLLTQALNPDKLGLRCLLRWKYRRLLFSMASPTASWGRAAITSACALTIRTDGGCIRRDCMSRFGNFIAAREFRKATSFITRTATHLITTTAIWSAYRAGNTIRSLARYLTQRSRAGTSMQSDPKLLSGTAPQTAATGPVGNLRDVGPSLRPKNTLASFAARSLSLARYMAGSTSALVFAAIGSGGQKAITTSTGSAWSAANHSTPYWPSTPVEPPRPVAEVAGESSDGSVFNLSVEGAGVYFANGILVSNCDQMTQALNRLRQMVPLGHNPFPPTRPPSGDRSWMA